jgi:hypothetical protein
LVLRKIKLDVALSGSNEGDVASSTSDGNTGEAAVQINGVNIHSA